MKITGKVHCMFEQSGTFKNEFLRLGIPAEDYDIQDEFGQTDNKIDLFAEIERGYDGKPSVFDGIAEDDLIMAFFPCIYFEAMQANYYRMVSCNNLCCKPKDEQYRIVIERIRQREKYYILLYKLFAICELRKLRMILENPSTKPHYLLHAANFIPPTFIDKDRALRGDYFHKPTAYWFINCSPTCGESLNPNRETRTVKKTAGSDKGGICSKERSMISPEYARNFICDFILGKENENTIPQLF